MIIDMLIVRSCIETYKEQSEKFIHLQSTETNNTDISV